MKVGSIQVTAVDGSYFLVESGSGRQLNTPLLLEQAKVAIASLARSGAHSEELWETWLASERANEALNTELFNTVLERIERYPDSWDQTVWHCGTAHCFAGLSEIEAYGTYSCSISTKLNAMNALGIDHEVAFWLFDANRTLADFKRARENGLFFEAVLRFDEAGLDADGYSTDNRDRDGFNADGYDLFGRDRDGYDRDGYDLFGYDRDGYDLGGYHRDGQSRDD